MELYSGDLYWTKTMKPKFQFENITESLQTDILIIGGGMSGTLCAHVLAKYGMNVTVVERKHIGEGSSAANTGLLQYTNDKMLIDLIKSIGEEKAVLFYKMCLEAMQKLDAINKELDGQTDYIQKESIYYASNEEDAEKLKEEFTYLEKYGFPVQFLTNEKLEKVYGIDKACAIKTSGDAEVNPYKFIQSLTEKNLEMGVHYYEQTEIDLENIEEHQVMTKEGHSLTFKQLILTTGYVKQYPVIQEKSEINRTYALCSEPLDKPLWKDEVMIWETKNPYLYFRTTSDHRIIAGGLDEKKNYVEENEAEIRVKANEIKNEIEKIFPNLDIKIAHAWSALFGESKDGLPFIGRDPIKKSVYYLMGYEGNGTCYSMAGAFILKDLLEGKSNKYEEIVQVDR